MKAEEVVKKWMSYETANRRNLFCKRGRIYSYGLHYPIAVILNKNEFLVNKDSSTTTTEKHKELVLKAIRKVSNHSIRYVSTNGLIGL